MLSSDDLLVQNADAATADELFDVVDEEAICGDHNAVRFENSTEFAGLFQVEEDFSLSGCTEENGVEFFEQCGVGIV